MSWDILKSKIFDYLNDSSEIKIDEQIALYVSKEISDYINTDIKTSFGNPVIIDQAMILGLIKSCNDSIKKTMNSFSGFANPSIKGIDTIQQFIDMKSGINDYIPKVPDELQIAMDLVDDINVDTIINYSKKFEGILENLSNAGFKIPNINIDELMKLNEDQLASIVDNIKIEITTEIENELKILGNSMFTSGIPVEFPMDFGIFLRFVAPDEISYSNAIDLMKKEIENKIKFNMQLSNPFIDTKSVLGKLLPDIEFVDKIKESIFGEVELYSNKINELISGGIGVESPIVKMFQDKIDSLQGEMQNKIENVISLSSPIELPKVDGILKSISDAGMSIITASIKIIPTNSALPGGIPINEQVNFPGIDAGMQLDSKDNTFYMAFLDMFKERLQSTSVINVSNYNNTIIPVTGNIIVT